MKTIFDKHFPALNCLLLSIILSASCENKDWNKHYNEDNRGEQVTTLVKAIREKGYEAYATALEKMKLDPALNTGMSYTLFVVPDAQFLPAMQGKTDDEIRDCMLNTISPGAYTASQLDLSNLRPIGGDALLVSIKNHTVANLHGETVNITQKDIRVANGVLFEISDFLPRYPDVQSWMKANGYINFLAELDNNYLIDSTYTVKELEFTDLGLGTVLTYPKTTFKPTKKPMEQLVFIVPDDNLFQKMLHQSVSKIKTYHAGAPELVELETDNYKDSLFVRNAGLSLIKSNHDDLGIIQLSKDTAYIPARKIKQTIKLSNGNTIILADTLFQPAWAPVREKLWRFAKDRTKFETVGEGFTNPGDWCSYVWTNQDKDKRKGGEKVIFTFPAKTLYTTEYEVEFRFNNAKDWPFVNFYINDHNLGEVNMRDKTETNRWDGACEDNGNIKFPTSITFNDFTQPVVITLEVTKEWGVGGELMAPFSVLFRIKE